MKTIYLLTTAFFLFITTNVFAQMDSAAYQKAWMAYMTPGPYHQKLAQFDGEWTADMTFWERPDVAPAMSTGTCIDKMILGGRYLESRYNSTMMGMPFEGIGTMAYDNNRKVFINSWIDNMSTGLMTLEGKWNDALNGIELHGKAMDPVTGKEVKIRQVMKWQDNNHHILEMYRTKGNKEMKEMQILFTRK